MLTDSRLDFEIKTRFSVTENVIHVLNFSHFSEHTSCGKLTTIYSLQIFRMQIRPSVDDSMSGDNTQFHLRYGFRDCIVSDLIPEELYRREVGPCFSTALLWSSNSAAVVARHRSVEGNRAFIGLGRPFSVHFIWLPRPSRSVPNTSTHRTSASPS